MDMAVLFMLFCSIPPFVLWSRRRLWALVQLPLIVGMWAYPLLNLSGGQPSPMLHTILAVLFYGNLVFTEAALVRWLIDIGNGLKSRNDSLA